MDIGYYQKLVELRFGDCDYKKRAKISTIMSYFADIAGLAYSSKGYNHTWLWERDFVFLLSRVSIHVERMPKADETIEVHTWERESKGVLFYRDYTIHDALDTIVVEASSAWILANPHTRQILKPSAFTGTHDPVNKEANAKAPAKFKIADPKIVGERTIVYSDIDANGHVNNAVYVSIACDFLPPELVEKDITDFRINFKQEAKLGQVMKVSLLTDDGKTFVVGEIGDMVSFESEFTFVV